MATIIRIQVLLMHPNTSPTPPGHWGNSSSQIKIIDRLLTLEELNELHRYARCNDDWSAVLTQSSWIDRVHRNFTENNAADISNKLYSTSKQIVETEFNVLVDSSGIQLNRWRAGEKQAPHADKQELDGGPNCCPGYDVSSIFYLNDDYEGGEIFFPNQSLTIKPTSNKLISFPGDIDFMHGVNKIMSGIRYTMTIFWTVLELKDTQ